jgi:hypothetical protein
VLGNLAVCFETLEVEQDLHRERLWVHRGCIEASGVVVLDVPSVFRARACCRIDVSVPALGHTALPILDTFLLARLDIGQQPAARHSKLHDEWCNVQICLLSS